MMKMLRDGEINLIAGFPRHATVNRYVASFCCLTFYFAALLRRGRTKQNESYHEALTELFSEGLYDGFVSGLQICR